MQPTDVPVPHDSSGDAVSGGHAASGRRRAASGRRHGVPSRRRAAAVGLLVLGLLVAACGGDQADRSAEPTLTEDGALRIVGQDNLRWNVEELTTEAGVVEFELVCEDAVNHNIVIDELDTEVAVCAPGETTRGSIELDPGTYTYVCTVPGHAATMRGTLTVE